jgi:hypothetical protein
MNLDEIWTSPLNAPGPLAGDRLVREALETVHRAQARRTAFLVWTAAALSAVTVGSGYLALARPADVGGMPALAVLVAAQWGVFALVLRQWLRTRTATRLPGATVQASLERLWNEVENERKRQLAVLGLFAVAVPALAASLFHLRDVGQMATHEAASAAVLFLLIVAGNLVAILVRRYTSVLPRRRRLEELLHQYQES